MFKVQVQMNSNDTTRVHNVDFEQIRELGLPSILHDGIVGSWVVTLYVS